MLNTIKQFLQHPLYSYDKKKTNVLKAIFPIVIIAGHMSQAGYSGLDSTRLLCVIVMYTFFAMSGYGLVFSYLKHESTQQTNRQTNKYINGFLNRSLPKLFIPYLAALIIFSVYRYFEGISQIEIFKTNGLFSLVPTSWYIYILALLYIFFYIVFRYVKANSIIKTFLVCGLVMGYVFIAPYLGISHWRYDKCPAFCAGMIIALFNNEIKTRLVRWHALACLILFLIVIKIPYTHFLSSVCFPTVIFFLMFLIKDIKESRIVNFISSISLEMFIIQYIPIYIVMNDFRISSTAIALPLVITLDIIIAYLIHLIIQPITKRIKG